MKIGFILPGFSAHANDWAIPALQSLTTRLAQTHSITVLSMRYPAKGQYDLEGVDHYALGAGQQLRLNAVKLWLQTVWTIVRQHQKTPFDLLHAFWADEAGFCAVLAGAIIRRPVVVSLGGWELTNLFEIDYGAQRFLSRRLTVKIALHQATRITAGSLYQRDLCRQLASLTQKLSFVPLGVDAKHFVPNCLGQKSETRLALVQVASLVPVKNQTLLLQTLRHIKAVIPNITLYLAGSGPLKPKLVELAQKLKVSDNLVWHDHYPHRRLPDLYQAADLYLQTSYHESQGMSVLEAMACGLPILGTPVGVVRDVACLPAQFEAEVLAEQARQVLSDSKFYRHQAKLARQLVEDIYSLDQSVTQYLQLYQQCL